MFYLRTGVTTHNFSLVFLYDFPLQDLNQTKARSHDKTKRTVYEGVDKMQTRTGRLADWRTRGLADALKHSARWWCVFKGLKLNQCS